LRPLIRSPWCPLLQHNPNAGEEQTDGVLAEMNSWKVLESLQMSSCVMLFSNIGIGVMNILISTCLGAWGPVSLNLSESMYGSSWLHWSAT
jgi:hypothetical protein